MNTLRVLAIVLALCVVGTSSIVAAENECLFKGDDPRLDKPITLSVDGHRLAEVMASMQRFTGVDVVAGSDANDWTVYDRKVILHVTNMKLRDLMVELAKVLSLRWTRTGDDGKWTYVLFSDAADETEEISLRTAADDAKAKSARQKRENALSDLVNLTNLARADVDRLKNSDPWRYILATESLGKDVAHFLKSHAESREAFLSGTGTTTPVAAMPAELQEAVKRTAVSYDALIKSIGASEDHSDLISKFDRLQITINRRPLTGTDVFTQSMLGGITIGYGVGQDSLEVPILDPVSPVAKAFGTAVLKLRSGAKKDDIAKQLQNDLQAAASAEDVVGHARDITSDPDLRSPVVLFDKAMTVNLTMTLRALAEKTKLNVVSDYFLATPSDVPAGRRPLGEQLEVIRGTYGTNWEKAGRTIRFRDSDWFRKRSWEVPQVWLDYWVDRGKRGQGLGLAELSQISKLRDEQIHKTILADPVLVRLGAGEAARNREILLFYGSLDDAQRASLGSQQLLVGSLSEDQWAALRKALATKGAAYAGVQRGSQSMRLAESVSDVIVHTFSYYPEGGDPPVTFKLTTGVVLRTGEELSLPEDRDVIELKTQPK